MSNFYDPALHYCTVLQRLYDLNHAAAAPGTRLNPIVITDDDDYFVHPQPPPVTPPLRRSTRGRVPPMLYSDTHGTVFPCGHGVVTMECATCRAALDAHCSG